MIYRRSEKADIETLIRMRLLFLRELHGPMPEGEQTKYAAVLEDYFCRCLGNSVLCYLAEEAGLCISVVYLCLYEKPASDTVPNGKFGTFFNVYTQPEYRKQGHSTVLLRMAIEDGRSRGLSNIDLMATAKGEGVYRALGFKEKQSHNKPMILQFMESN